MWKPVDQHVEEWGQEEITDGKDIVIMIILIIMIINIIITWWSVPLRRVREGVQLELLECSSIILEPQNML